MAKPVSLTEFDYVPRCDRDEHGAPVSDATKFRLAPLKGWQLQEVYLETKHLPGRGAGGEDALVLNGEAFHKLLRFGLRDWENFGDAAFGANLEENIGRLGQDLTVELALEILERSQLSEAQKKS